MKYLIVVDDNFISNFRRDDDGLTLVVKDESDATRAVRLKPIIRPVVVSTEGESAYLSKGHIDTLIEYERQQTFREAVEHISKSFDGWGDIDDWGDIEKSYTIKLPYRVNRPCFGCKYKLETPHGIQCSFTDCVWEREDE